MRAPPGLRLLILEFYPPGRIPDSFFLRRSAQDHHAGLAMTREQVQPDGRRRVEVHLYLEFACDASHERALRYELAEQYRTGKEWLYPIVVW